MAEKLYNLLGDKSNELFEENDIETTKMDVSENSKTDSNRLWFDERYDVKELDGSSFSIEDVSTYDNYEFTPADLKTINKIVDKVIWHVDNYVEFLVIHEITHDIATKEMKELILDYAKQDSEFNDSLETLKKRYKTDDVSEEVVADVCGELFGNREFIQSVVEKKSNIFKKILNNIRKLAEKIKGTGVNEYVNFVEKLKTMWEDAYYSNQSNLNTTMFSIQTDSNGSKYVNVDIDQDIFKGKNLAEQTKIAKQYILDNFRGKELLINDSSAMVTRKTANEYTHPKTTLQKKDAGSKMKASTELDNLLLISEYKYSKSDDGRHSFAKDGWDYYETIFKVGDIMYNGLVNIAKNGNKKMLYDITNLKRNTQISSPVNTATESIGIPFSKKNIS